MEPLHHSQTDPELRRASIPHLAPSRKNRRAKDDASTDTTAAGDPGLPSPALSSPGLSPVTSNDSRLDRLKDKFKTSNERRDSNDSYRRRLSARIPGRRRKRDNDGDDSVADGVAEAESTPDIESPYTRDDESPSRTDSIASSQMTEDADAGQLNQTPTRPGIATRQSHAGYLTLSSPLISSETIEAHDEQSRPTLNDTLALNKSATLAAPTSDKKRTSSPVGKLKDAISLSRRSSKSDLKERSDSESTKRSGSITNTGEKAGANSKGAAGVGSGRPRTEPDKSVQDSTRGRPKTPHKVTTNVTPSTPPTREPGPTTLITPPTPPDFKHNTSASGSTKGSPKAPVLSGRRQAPPNPSKLINAVSAPLTPTIEEAETPGGPVKPNNSTVGAGGFFSSVFSATQSAATQLTNTILNPSLITGQRVRSGTNPDQTEKTGPAGGEEVISPVGREDADTATRTGSVEKRELAVETLGSGNLSLTHLGIAEAPSHPAKRTRTEMATSSNGVIVQTEEVHAIAEDDAASKAISAAYDKSSTEKASSSLIVSRQDGRTKSITSESDKPAQLQHQSSGGEPSVLRRTGSIRSRVSDRRKRRHRGSSATTGNTIAAAIGAGHAALANPQQNSGPKLTGFAVANPKRNREFHSLFRSVPEDDYLIEDYSAALQRDILLQGRLYVSEGHICFSSNILGWVTNLVISFDEIVSVEKKSTAVIFPNAIVIQTLHARNVFASLVSRDTAYDLLINIWKINHPNLKSSLNGVALDDGTGDKTEKAGSVAASASVGEEESDEETDDDVYDEDDEEDLDASVVNGLGSDDRAADADGGDADRSVTRKTSAAAFADKVAGGEARVLDGTEAAVVGAASSADFPGPTSHVPTSCGDEASHYDKVLMDTTIPAPLGKIYSLMFGPASGAFMRKWLIEDQRCGQDLTLEDDKRGLDNGQKTMSFSYIKPLPGSIGPRQTKCITSYTLEQFDLEKAVTINSSTQTPDVPSGGIFVVKTRYCLMWAPGNSTRLIMNCTIEWSGKSWLKGPIEKGANDGQQQYGRDIVNALKTAVTAAPVVKTPAKTATGKKKKAKSQESVVVEDSPVIAAPGPTKVPRSDSNTSESLVMKIVLAILSIMVFWMWFRTPSRQTGLDRPGSNGLKDRYEQMWESEESELWHWLEDRVSRGDSLGGISHNVRRSESDRAAKKKDKKRNEMDQREVEEAIRITKERLAVLEAVMRKEEDGEGYKEL